MIKPITDHKRAFKIASWAYLKDLPNDDIIGIKEKNDSCCIIIHDDHIEIGVAGSNDKWDWVHNVRFIGTKTEHLGRVHRGFYTNVENMVDKITLHIKRHIHLPILFRLHSRGGPVGACAAFELRKKGYDVISIVGCGVPNFLKKKGVEEFAKAGFKEIIFYRYGSDPVATLLSWFYTKPTKNIEYGRKRRWWSAVKIKDHYMPAYTNSYGNYRIDYMQNENS